MPHYPTKAAHIRALLAEGKSKSEAARISGASYPQVHGIYQAMTGTQRRAALQQLLRQDTAKPFKRGSRVVHQRQVNLYDFGVVLRSGPHTTVVRFSGRKQLRDPAVLHTRDLIRAPGRKL